MKIIYRVITNQSINLNHLFPRKGKKKSINYSNVYLSYSRTYCSLFSFN